MFEWFINKTADGSVLVTFTSPAQGGGTATSHIRFTAQEWARFQKDVK